jgi:CHAT domain-containing protein
MQVSLRILSFSFALLGGTVVAFGQSQADVNRLMQEASALAQKGDNEGAVKRIEQLIAIAEKARAKPEELVQLYEAGAYAAANIVTAEGARKAVGFVDKALPILRRGGDRNRIAALTNLRAYQAMMAGDTKAAEKSFDDTTQLRPDLNSGNELMRAAISGDQAAIQKALSNQGVKMAGYGMDGGMSYVTAETMLSNNNIAEARPQILKLEDDMFARRQLTLLPGAAEGLGMSAGMEPRMITLGVLADLLFYPGDTEIRRNALQLLFSLKNAGFESGARSLRTLRANSSADASAIRQQLMVQYARIAQVWGQAALEGKTVSTSALKPLLDEVAKVEERANKLEEAEFAKRVNGQGTNIARAINPIPRVPDVAAALSKDSALVEFARVDWFDYRKLKPTDTLEQRKAMKFEPHYVAYILTADGTIRSLDLGVAAGVDGQIHDLLSRMDSKVPVAELQQYARKLHAQVWKPLEAALGGRTLVFVSPDSQLALLPFDVLVDEKGRSLIETYSISYLFSGIQLVRPPASRPAQMTLAVFAGPDFLRTGTSQRAQSLQNRFAMLPNTLQEARAIQRIVPAAKVFTGADASESNLKKLPAAAILHVATHGYYVESDASQTPSVNMTLGTWAPYQSMRSGLVLREAGRSEPGEDGLLTAIEISTLDLSATKLVVLSACDSGVGDPSAGGSVSGLRNAFQTAGAQALITSLWKVDDAAGKELMEAFYENLAAGQTFSDALRLAKLEMRKLPARSHPYFWAPFGFEGQDQTVRF